MRIVAEAVAFTYPGGDQQVLAGVDFEILSGQSVAVIGPSGSGKTTLLALVGSLLPMQAGTITAIDGAGVRRPVDQFASWVPQTVSLLPDRTVADNIAIGAYSDGARRAESAVRVRESLAAVDLSGRGGDPARILSGGEAQRVAIARALASWRPIILADEPTGQLDARTSVEVLRAMIESRGRRTVVVVSHDPEVAERCEVVLELRDGLIHQVARA